MADTEHFNALQQISSRNHFQLKINYKSRYNLYTEDNKNQKSHSQQAFVEMNKNADAMHVFYNKCMCYTLNDYRYSKELLYSGKFTKNILY